MKQTAPSTTDQASAIHVTKTYLPEQAAYRSYLDSIWESNWVTNNGPLVQQLEGELASYLKLPGLEYVSNGTVALQLAIKCLELKGEIITTPFSYVATTNSILWEGCKPVYADIDLNSLCIDTTKIEALINENTVAIMATHVFGIPCDVEGIDALARRYGLKVIYDGAHAFGVRLNGRSLLSYGDVSTISFHATKVFHTIEGGAVVSSDPNFRRKVFRAKAFGHVADEYFDIGINAKNSEFHAAIGLANLEKIDEVLLGRRTRYLRYLSQLKGENYDFLRLAPGVDYNYGYFPLVFKDEASLKAVMEALAHEQVFPRRYFWPSLNRLPHHQGAACINAERISQSILCLPLYHDLPLDDVDRIAAVVDHTFETQGL